MSNDKSVVGDLINLRGLVYAPMNENGVVFLSDCSDLLDLSDGMTGTGSFLLLRITSRRLV
ncbi:MAG: hypothetical protein DRP66_03220 [Planctomycetota bacterium]|nr:MAG: hypothetical protein DRP66_03220 [Planctomycetota bacterium]